MRSAIEERLVIAGYDERQDALMAVESVPGFGRRVGLKLDGAAKEWIRPILAAHETRIEEERQEMRRKAEEKERNRIAPFLAEAKETGERVQIRRYSTGCNDRREECSLDIVTEWALPDDTDAHVVEEEEMLEDARREIATLEKEDLVEILANIHEAMERRHDEDVNGLEQIDAYARQHNGEMPNPDYGYKQAEGRIAAYGKALDYIERQVLLRSMRIEPQEW